MMDKVYVSITRGDPNNYFSYSLHQHPLWRKDEVSFPSHISINTTFGLGIPPEGYGKYYRTPILSKEYQHIDDYTFTPHEIMKYGKYLYYPIDGRKRYITHVLYRKSPCSHDFTEMTIDDFLLHVCSIEIDYEYLYRWCGQIREELMEKTWHPSRLPWVISHSDIDLHF
jgi:hypothetical protein